MRLPIGLRTFVIGALIVSATCPGTARAWGSPGHRITGYIATAQLTQTTSTAVKDILGTDDLSTAATYMDDRKSQLEAKYPTSRKWHYNNRPVCAPNAPFSQYCDSGDCV